MQVSFDDGRVLGAINKLQTHQQLAAAAACCERLLPNYAAFVAQALWGDPTPLRAALDAIWDVCARGSSLAIGVESLADLLAQCERAAPNSDDFALVATTFAQDAVFSICALLDFLQDHTPERIATALRFATDSVDLFVQELEDMDPLDPRRGQRIHEHPLMQQELTRQRRDLHEAGQLDAGEEAGLWTFRQRALAEHSLTLA
jgi:uncharacterized protein YjaG (DUF416 family)